MVDVSHRDPGKPPATTRGGPLVGISLFLGSVGIVFELGARGDPAGSAHDFFGPYSGVVIGLACCFVAACFGEAGTVRSIPRASSDRRIMAMLAVLQVLSLALLAIPHGFELLLLIWLTSWAVALVVLLRHSTLGRVGAGSRLVLVAASLANVLCLDTLGLARLASHAIDAYCIANSCEADVL